MPRFRRPVTIVLIALLAALGSATGALAQAAGTPVATPATGSITVVTVDQQGYALAGACYNLVANGTLLAAATCSGQQGVVVFSDLAADGSSYAIGEAQAPDGCEGQEVPGVTLTPDNPTPTITVTNDCGESNGVTNNGSQGNGGSQPPWTGTLTIHTVDQGGNPLAGACYTLGTAPGFMAMQAGDAQCSGPDGTVVISGFWARDGNVQVTQTQARPGCQADGAISSLTFSQANATQEITVTNTCQTSAPAPRPVQQTSPATTISRVAARLGADLPPVATHALDTSVHAGNAIRG